MARGALPSVLIVLALAAAGGAWLLMTGREPDGARSAPPAVEPAGGATADGGAQAGHPGQRGQPGQPNPALPAAPGASAAQSLDAAAPGRRAFGRVVDAGGQGVAGAQVACFREAGGLLDPLRQPLGIGASTDSSGAFELLGLPTDRPLGIDVRHPGFAPTERTPFTASEGQSTDLGQIALDAGLLLIGNVRAADGRPIAGALVTLAELGAPATAQGAPESREATTGADGEYRFDHLAPRQFTVDAQAEGYAPRTATLALVLGAATGNTRQDFKLAPADSTLAGLVRDGDDRPVPGATLRLTQHDRNAHDYVSLDRTTDAQGRFEFEAIAAGLYQLEVLGATWYLPKPLTVQGGERSLDVRVQAARSVTGRVSGSAGPPRDFTVAIKPQGATGARLLGETRATLTVTGAEPPGTFVYGGLRPGAYRFEIRAPGYAVTTSPDVILGTESPTAEVQIELAVGGTIDGRIAPAVAGVPVELRDADYDPAAPMESVLPTRPIHDLATKTDADGAFRLAHVPAGRYTLTARASGAPPLHRRDLEVVEGGQVDVGALELPRGGFIFGNVIGVDGQPSVGARVTAVASGRMEQAVTDATGAFRLPPLVEGDYELRAVPATMWEALRFEAHVHVTLHAGDEMPVLMTFVERSSQPR